MLALLPQEHRDASVPASRPVAARQALRLRPLARHIVENPMLNGETIRPDALRMPPK
jgi:hypothetical protein